MIKIIISGLFIVLLLAHLILFGLFFCPVSKVLPFFSDNVISFVALPEVPDYVRQAFAVIDGKNLDNISLLQFKEKSFIQVVVVKSLALRNNKMFNTDKRFELYLNTLNFGGGVIGIQAASDYYFKKPVQDLSFEEALMLAGVYKIFNN